MTFCFTVSQSPGLKDMGLSHGPWTMAMTGVYLAKGLFSVEEWPPLNKAFSKVHGLPPFLGSCSCHHRSHKVKTECNQLCG